MKSGTFTNNTLFTASAATVNVPTGTYAPEVGLEVPFTFTVPDKITVVEVSDKRTDNKRYIGVTPGKAYELIINAKPPGVDPQPNQLLMMLTNNHNYKVWDLMPPNNNFIISWSPEINKQTPTIKDY